MIYLFYLPYQVNQLDKDASKISLGAIATAPADAPIAPPEYELYGPGFGGCRAPVYEHQDPGVSPMDIVREDSQEQKLDLDPAELERDRALTPARRRSRPGEDAPGHGARGETQYVGLTNQGATCYMNCLLQSLFMTSGFRQALYDWKYNPEHHGEAQDCIPLQLQRLFAELQLGQGVNSTTSTQRLTQSFGWGDGEGFRQHDVQELLRKLFDAIEQAMPAEQYARMVSRLYKGEFSNVVECKGCGAKSERKEMFLDVSLVVRGVDSVEQALANFLASEVLEGANAYRCGACGLKCTAEKRTELTQLPSVLTLQLKRFDLDYETMRRFKQEHRVIFPTTLKSKLFKSKQKQKQEGKGGWFTRKQKGQGEAEAAAEAEVEVEKAGAAKGAAEHTKEDGDVDKDKASMEHDLELLAVLVHAGSAAAGHYFAFIREPGTGRWLKFNDSSVTVTTLEDVEERSFGGVNQSSAYMLIYRREGVENSVQPDVPAAAEQWYRKEQRESQLDNDPSSFKLTVYCKHEQKHGAKDGRSAKVVKLPRQATVREATELAWQEHDLQSVGVPLQDVRLREYDASGDSPGSPFDANLEKSLGVTVFRSPATLLLETRKPGVGWRKWNSSEVAVWLYLADAATQSMLPKRRVLVSTRAGKLDLQEASLYDLGVAAKRFWRVNLSGDVEELVEPNHFYLRNGAELYADVQEEGPAPVLEALQRCQNMIRLYFNLLESSVADQCLEIEADATLAEAKLRICEVLNTPPDQVQLLRDSSYDWVYDERELARTLRETPLKDQSVVKTRVQLEAGAKRVNFMLNDLNAECGLAVLTPLCELGVHDHQTVGELKVGAQSFGDSPLFLRFHSMRLVRLQALLAPRVAKLLGLDAETTPQLWSVSFCCLVCHFSLAFDLKTLFIREHSRLRLRSVLYNKVEEVQPDDKKVASCFWYSGCQVAVQVSQSLCVYLVHLQVQSKQAMNTYFSFTLCCHRAHNPRWRLRERSRWTTRKS